MSFSTLTAVAAGLVAIGLGLAAETAHASYTVAVKKRTLVITGDAASEKLSLRVRGRSLVVDGRRDALVRRRRFDRIRVRAGSGNDTVRIVSTGRVPVRLEGGRGTDRLAVSGTAAGEAFRLGRNRLTLDRAATRLAGIEHIAVAARAGADTLTIDAQARAITADLGGTDGAADRVIVNGTAGSDTIAAIDTAVTGLAASIALTGREPGDGLSINALGGDDSVSGQTTAFTADGGEGADTLAGGPAPDALLGGAGPDRFTWERGDGADTIDGQGDEDVLAFTGSDLPESFAATADDGRVRLSRADETSPAEVTVLDGIERLDLAMLGGADDLTVGDLSATDLTAVDAALGAGLTSDSVVVNGSESGDAITATSAPGGVTVAVGARTVAVTGAVFPQDAVAVNGHGGDDAVRSSGLAAGVIRFAADGGPGDDELAGGPADERLTGGDGNDRVAPGPGIDDALLGAGEDVLFREIGDRADTIDGEAGFDVLESRGTPDDDIYGIVPSGGGPGVLFDDDAGPAAQVRAIESVRVYPLAGGDRLLVEDLRATSVERVSIALALDGSSDQIDADGTAGADLVTVGPLGGAGTAQVALPGQRQLFVTGAEPGDDELSISSRGGDDRVDASSLPADAIDLSVLSGSGDDVLLGGAGGDALIGGDGDDRLAGGDGDDALFGGNGNDDLLGGAGDDRLRGEAGHDSLFGGPGNDDLDGGPGSDNEVEG